MASSLELNKLAAGVLTAGIIAFGAAVFSGLLYYPRTLEQHAFTIVVEEDEVDVAAAEAVDEPSLAVLLASADPTAGQAITRQCTACHVFEEGGANRVGPYLWDTVGRDIASVSGFNYSGALQEIEGDWTFEALDGFLANPRGWAPGTSMSYAGLRTATDRANLIAYMREQSNDPVPLPEPDAEAAAAAPVEDAAADVAPGDPEVAEALDEPAPVEEEVAEAMPPAAVDDTEELTAVPEVPEERVVEAPEAVETPADAAEVVEEETTAEAAIPAVTEAEPAEEAVEEPVEVVEEATNGAELSAMVALVAAADPAVGERNFRQCAACHTVDQGGPNRVGPNLWDVFGADIGHHDGFNYSDALLSIEGVWTVDKLDAYLENPRGFAPGNRMAFAGLRNEADRAAMIAYLRTLSEDPEPVDID